MNLVLMQKEFKLWNGNGRRGEDGGADGSYIIVVGSVIIEIILWFEDRQLESACTCSGVAERELATYRRVTLVVIVVIS